MKYNSPLNNKGSLTITIIIAVVSILVLGIGSYFLFFNKSIPNPIASLTNKCTGEKKACDHFDSINKFREENKLSPLKWDSAICSRIQNFSNDLKEIYKNDSNLKFDSQTKKTFDNLRNDSKYNDLVGDYDGVEEIRNKDKRIKFNFNATDAGDLKVDVDHKSYGKNYKQVLLDPYTHACIVVSDSEIEGKNDFAVWYFVQLRETN